MGNIEMASLGASEIAARNKGNYLKAKAAFNAKDMAGCMSFYAPDHQIRSRDVGPGREHIEQFLTSMHESWSDLQIIVEHAVAEDDWVMATAQRFATHAKAAMALHRPTAGSRRPVWDCTASTSAARLLKPGT